MVVAGGYGAEQVEAYRLTQTASMWKEVAKHCRAIETGECQDTRRFPGVARVRPAVPRRVPRRGQVHPCGFTEYEARIAQLVAAGTVTGVKQPLEQVRLERRPGGRAVLADRGLARAAGSGAEQRATDAQARGCREWASTRSPPGSRWNLRPSRQLQ